MSLFSSKDLTFFLPLCGKAGDLVWLHAKGAKVIGVEIVEKAIIELYEENDIQYRVEEINGVPTYTVSKNESRSRNDYQWWNLF